MKINISWIFNAIMVLIVFLVLSNLVNIVNLIIDSGFEVNLNKDLIESSLSNRDTYKSLFNINTPINFIGIGLMVMFILKLVFPNKKNTGYDESFDYGSHGTSRWQTNKEIKLRYYKNKKGWFLGSLDKNLKFKNKMDVAYHPVDGDLNMQMVVIGSPGSQKTTGFVYPNILHLCDIYKNTDEKADMIITDPKSELFSETANYLEDNGYDVKVLDFIHLKYGNTLNPLLYVNDDKTLMEIAQGYVDAVEGSLGGGNGDSFWIEQEGQLLGALIGFVKQVYRNDESKQTFSQVLKILTSENVMDFKKAKEFFIEHDIKGAPLQLWNNYLGVAKSDNTRSGIVGGLATKLKLFAIDGIVNISGSSNIPIENLGTKKNKPMAIFIFMPDSDRTFAPIINSIVTIIFKQLYKTAYKTNNKLERPVYFILEEMANIGKISGILEMLGTMRGRRIYPMMIWQSLSQMKNRYTEDGMEDLMSQCDTHVYLGINDDFTAQYCSKSLGETTIRIENDSVRLGGQGMIGNISESQSHSYQSRRLLLSDECMKLDNKKMIIKQRATDPFILNKVQYKYWEKRVCEYKTIDTLNLLCNIETINCNSGNYISEKEHIEEHINDDEKDGDINNFFERDYL